MLMLTHAWLLEHFLGERYLDPEHQDLFVYNICPDFLPIHKRFTSDITHGISRFRKLPVKYRKGAFIHFHLMVDDISHHGLIDKIPVREFNPDSKGYTYLKGKPLIQPLMDLYRNQKTPIDFSVAAYRSHMIIEMTYDLTLFMALPEESRRLVSLMCDAMQMTMLDKLDEFSTIVGWFYDSDSRDVSEALRKCAQVYTMQRMNSFMNLEGRMRAFSQKFGLAVSDDKALAGLKEIMMQGMDLIGDYREFLDPTLAAIKKVGFNPSVLV